MTAVPARGLDWGPFSIRLDRRWHLRLGRFIVAHCRQPSHAPLIDRAGITVTTARPDRHPTSRSGPGYAIRPLRLSVCWLWRPHTSRAFVAAMFGAQKP